MKLTATNDRLVDQQVSLLPVSLIIWHVLAGRRREKRHVLEKYFDPFYTLYYTHLARLREIIL